MTHRLFILAIFLFQTILLAAQSDHKNQFSWKELVEIPAPAGETIPADLQSTHHRDGYPLVICVIGSRRSVSRITAISGSYA